LHSKSLYDAGNNLVASTQGEDLYALVRTMCPQVLDSGAEWKKLSLCNPGTAYLLGPTFIREQGNLQGALFNEKARAGRENVFLLSREDRCICIERLDKYFRQTFTKRIPRLDQFTPDGLRNWNDSQTRDQLQDEVREHMMEPSLSERIVEDVKYCLGNFDLSAKTAYRCYAKLLLEEKPNGAELKKFRQGDRHCFGDCELIMIGLFFGGAVISNDRAAIQMGKMVKIQAHARKPRQGR